MPRDPNRLRHGMGHSRLPVPVVAASSGASPAPKLTPTGAPQKTQGRDAAPVALPPRVVPVSIINAFYQMLPNPSIQQQSVCKENRFAANDLNDGLTIGEVVTRDEQVYIWTDILFYALLPGNGMSSPSVAMTDRQLSGLVRFDVMIGGNSPMNLVANTESPYNDPVFSQQGNLPGWQTLNKPFGSTRFGSAFALYSRSGQAIKVVMRAVQRDRYPRFVIDRVGFEAHGYVCSEAEFDTVWRRTVSR